ncbi:MAG: transglutaminase domain-containing protein, partial [bacterium]
YFASAQAILLRILGRPTRIVNGFRRGEYNEWGAYFIVRASDAHSWVEAYFPGAGWTEFDPTPPATPENSFRLLRTFSRMMDSVEVLWGEVVTFDRFKQAGFFQLLRNKIERNWAQVLEGYRMILEHGRGDPSSVMKWMWSLRLELSICTFFVLAAAVLYWVRTRLVRMWRGTTRKWDETEFARDYYLEMLDLLREKGFVKSRFETPAEFGLRVSSRMGTELPSRITESYYETRFGGILLDTRQLADVYSLLNPDLFIMDAVLGLHGQGPAGGGDPVGIGLALASTDGIAMDISVCRLIGIEPTGIPLLKRAKIRGMWPNKLSYPLLEPGDNIIKDFKMPNTASHLQSGKRVKAKSPAVTDKC